MSNRRMLDRNYLAAAQVIEKKPGASGKSFETSMKRKLVMWASYNEKLEKAFAAQSQR